ncbi:hypothetical protein [Streptomyces sp. NPDC093111]|uniref:hypothetical protein n=1 Tax=Streptomyces sp. NPDC093111 TaxID=3154978 RepID=UPI003415AFF3
MEDELTAFSLTAGARLVAVMTTDAHPRALQAVLEQWRRIRPAEADILLEQLEDSRAALMDARARGIVRREGELGAWWQERLTWLFSTDPRAVGALHLALTRKTTEATSQVDVRAGSIRMAGRARGHARVFQAGRDQHIIEH